MRMHAHAHACTHACTHACECELVYSLSLSRTRTVYVVCTPTPLLESVQILPFQTQVAVFCSVLQCFAVFYSVLQFVAICCNVLQCVAVCCSVSQCVGSHFNNEAAKVASVLWAVPTFLKYPAHCNTPQHTATHYNTMQHTATHCNTLQHTATHCNTLQHNAPHCNTLQNTNTSYRQRDPVFRAVPKLQRQCSRSVYGVATVRRIDEILSLFCRILSLL